MNLDKITAGPDLPHDINVVIEIPSHDYPVKYELDKESGALVVDRFMNTAMFYPCNYGFVPNTLAEDGDPVDVLVLTPVPVIAGSVIRCRPVGMLKMTDEAGPDVKVLAVPVDKLHTRFSKVEGPGDLPRDMLAQITHFFEQYKQLEPDKWVKVEEWADAEEAKAELVAGQKRYQKSKV